MLERFYNESTPNVFAEFVFYPKFGLGAEGNARAFHCVLNSRCPTLPLGPTRYEATLYSERLSGNQFHPDLEHVEVIIGVYDKDPTVSLTKWLSKFMGPVRDASKGNIANALTKAYAGERGIITYDEREEGDKMVSEVGAVAVGGKLSYTTLFTQTGLKYAYAIELLLEFDKKATEPSDEQYIALNRH